MNQVLTLKVKVDLRWNIPLRDVEGFDFNKFFLLPERWICFDLRGFRWQTSSLISWSDWWYSALTEAMRLFKLFTQTTEGLLFSRAEGSSLSWSKHFSCRRRFNNNTNENGRWEIYFRIQKASFCYVASFDNKRDSRGNLRN